MAKYKKSNYKTKSKSKAKAKTSYSGTSGGGKFLSIIIWLLVGIIFGIAIVAGTYYLFVVLPGAGGIAIPVTSIQLDHYNIIF